MADWDSTTAATFLSAVLGLSSFPTVGGTHLRLGTTTPTATSHMTELVATGYTAGGMALTWASPSGNPAASHNTASLTWTNSGSTDWPDVVGGEVWTTAGTPLRLWWTVWVGAPIVVVPGDTFPVAVQAISLFEG
jgi:hypothetical protein